MRTRTAKPALRRSVVRRVLVALLVTLSLTAPVVPDAEAASSSAALPGCSYSTARVLGWVWADGKYNETNDWFFFRTKSRAISKHLKEKLNELDVDFLTGTSRAGHYNFRIMLDGYDNSFIQSNPMNNPAVSCDPRAFLASVIETEGSTSGKIMDDPAAVRRNGARAVLDAVNIDSFVSGQAVKAERSDWFRLRLMPFLVCGRVPGGATNCVLGQTG